MMKRLADRKLESSKLFPYIAWGLIIIFGVCVTLLAKNLNKTADKIDTTTSSLETKANASTKDLKTMDFEQ